MPFGLKIASRTVQRAMKIILSTVKWKFVLIYLDEVIIFWRSVEEHLNKLRTVLRLQVRSSVSLKLKRFSFENRINYLGHRNHPGRLKKLMKATNANGGIQKPSNVTERNSSSDQCSLFTRFLPNLARIAAPLIWKLEKDQHFHFRLPKEIEV